MYRYHGRRSARGLRAKKQFLYQEALPRLKLKPEQLGALKTAFPVAVKNLWMEIGFGNGEHLADQAIKNPDIGFIGVEPFKNGVAALLSKIDQSNINNILIYPDPLQNILADFPENCLDRVFILFPDPWPKNRHHRRRLISNETLDGLAKVMTPNGLLRIATDHPNYMVWILRHMLDHPLFSWPILNAEDWQYPPKDAVMTRYQEKAQARGADCWYFNFYRR